MEIRVSEQSKTSGVEQWSIMQAKRKEMEENGSEKKIADKNAVLQDEYIHSEESGNRFKGLYGIEFDKYGNRKIWFVNPKKVEQAEQTEQFEKAEQSENGNSAEKNDIVDREVQNRKAEEDLGNQSEKWKCNTDRVDREIEKLKKEKQQLEQQIQAAYEDEEKIRELEQKMERVEAELRHKENDTYRRMNSVISKVE